MSESRKSFMGYDNNNNVIKNYEYDKNKDLTKNINKNNLVGHS